MMTVKKLFGAAVTLLVVSAIGTSRLEGQDCGSTCSHCGFLGYEGRDWQAGGAYNMTCFDLIPYCVACPHQNSVGKRDAETATISALIESGSVSRLRELVAAERHRILVSPTRNLAVIRGSPCRPDALGTVVFLSPDRARALGGLGLTDLDDYLAANGTGALGTRDQT
jgi:hypothetical protein